MLDALALFCERGLPGRLLLLRLAQVLRQLGLRPGEKLSHLMSCHTVAHRAHTVRFRCQRCWAACTHHRMRSVFWQDPLRRSSRRHPREATPLEHQRAACARHRLTICRQRLCPETPGALVHLQRGCALGDKARLLRGLLIALPLLLRLLQSPLCCCLPLHPAKHQALGSIQSRTNTCDCGTCMCWLRLSWQTWLAVSPCAHPALRLHADCAVPF